MQQVLLYHGSGETVMFPEIRKTRYTKDFSWGFYCTRSYSQAYRWAGRKSKTGIVNIYSYIEDSTLKILKFNKMNDEWLDFVSENRNGVYKGKKYGIIIGPVANDDVYTTLQLYLGGFLTREQTMQTLKVKKLYDQYVFATQEAMDLLQFKAFEEVK